MTRPSTQIVGLPRLIILGLLGGIIGSMVAAEWNPLPLRSRTDVFPAPYRVPKIPGGTALRLAMVHDILHERYLRHGPAWYIQRNIEARKIIAQEAPAPNSPASQKYLNALDDLAIGLERTGNYEEAIATMRGKLLLVSPLPAAPATRPTRSDTADVQTLRAIDEADLDRILVARDLPPFEVQRYTTCRNLGTILVHSFMPKALAGDSEAQSQVREGLTYIERAIGINPGAHFGRETWQAIAIEDLLAAIDHPDLLTKYDLIGDLLNVETGQNSADWRITLKPPNPADRGLLPDERLNIRSDIPRTGINPDWAAIVHADYSLPMPFDEPTLAIIGMWTLGGGPNPHFALALGRIMENVGQRSIAWNAYERAAEMKDQFWPDPAIRERMMMLCRKRQQILAAQEEPADDGRGWQDTMRRQHQGELAWGQAYQKAYQDYEASQIAAGVPLDAPDFYAAFFKGRPSIASSPGLADDITVTHLKAPTWMDTLPCAFLGAGLAMLIGLIRRRADRPY